MKEEKDYLLKCIKFLEDTKPSGLVKVFGDLKWLTIFKGKFLPRLRSFITGEPKKVADMTDQEVKDFFQEKGEVLTKP